MLTWPVLDTWRALGRWIGTCIRGQEAAGRFWKSEAQALAGGRVCAQKRPHRKGRGQEMVGWPVAGRPVEERRT
jgi:hypothetical protein